MNAQIGLEGDTFCTENHDIYYYVDSESIVFLSPSRLWQQLLHIRSVDSGMKYYRDRTSVDSQVA